MWADHAEEGVGGPPALLSSLHPGLHTGVEQVTLLFFTLKYFQLFYCQMASVLQRQIEGCAIPTEKSSGLENFISFC